jgi:flagellar hook-associated protein 3 FlgL
MISSLKASDQNFLADLQRIAERVERAQRQLSTGLRVATVTDDPDLVGDILQARSDLGRAEQIRFNLGRVELEIATADQSLQAAVKILDRVRTLGSQGATGTATAASRAILAEEVGAALEQLVGISRARVEGRYLFSGDSDTQPPFDYQAGGAPPVSPYLGSAATRQAEHPNGTTFSIARTGEEIFDPADPADSVFRTVEALRAALAANDEQAILEAVANLARPAGHLNRQIAFYGSVSRQVTEAQEFAARFLLQARSQLAALQEADAAEAILELNQARYAQETALKVRAQTATRSLFDYLG